ncbi:MAG TPA: thioredoxin-disulfide reductase [Caldisericia bacterium]|nr:thioredoxin-disulfide reductase [Caldisericia bacterium]HQG59668.1 thioredoxin-disulfide reductase [Caldisericia bacterium]HQH49008.1 thioredoxin-disulfide reductase [Caldisericia bacterium]HQJ44161.1 thioredoxin-disulfide reductase [Caldisericia bacterium]
MKEFDVAIIGGGPAGLGAAIYSGRAMLKTVLFDKFGTGGQLNSYEKIANYPGFFEDTPTYKLSESLLAHAQRFGAEIIYDEIISISDDEEWKILKGFADSYRVHASIVATGVRYKNLGVEGEEKLRGRGVSYCATCDGPFFVGKDIVVVGGGDSALQEAQHLTQFGREVTIIHRRDEFRAYPDLREMVQKHPKIKCLMNSTVQSIEGKDFVEGIIIKNVVTGEVSKMKTNAVFIFVGLQPNTEFLSGYADLDDYGYVKTGEDMSTSKKGVFAAGDIRIKDIRQVITAVSDGAIAAQSAWKYMSCRK